MAGASSTRMPLWLEALTASPSSSIAAARRDVGAASTRVPSAQCRAT